MRSGQSQRQQTDANGLPGHYQTVRSGLVRSGRSQRQQTDAGIGRTSCHDSRVQNVSPTVCPVSIRPCVSVECVAVSHRDKTDRQTPASAGRCTRVLHDCRAQNMTARDANALSLLSIYLAVRSGKVRSGQSERQRTDAGFGRALYVSVCLSVCLSGGPYRTSRRVRVYGDRFPT